MHPPELSAVFLLVASSLYAGFQWTIRVLVYPQFASVPAGAFERYEERHQRLVSYAVGPLFIADGAASIAAFTTGPRVPAVAAAGCVLLVLAVTTFGAVPLHRRLSTGFDRDVHRRLLVVDSVRLAVAIAGVGAAVWFAVAS